MDIEGSGTTESAWSRLMRVWGPFQCGACKKKRQEGYCLVSGDYTMRTDIWCEDCYAALETKNPAP